MKTLKQISEQLKDGINQFIDSAESNENNVDSATDEMKMRIEEAKTFVATEIAKEQLLKTEYQQAVQTLNRSREKAELVSQTQDSETNNDAQQRVYQHQNRVNELETQIHAQEAIVADLIAALKEIYQQFRSTSVDLDNLSQRHQQAKSRANFNKLLAEFELSDARIAIHQAEKELRNAEAEAIVWEKRRQRKNNQDMNKKEEGFNVDEALAALKKDILGSSQND